MERVTLGRSGLSVSPIAFGTWQLSPRFWGEQPKGDVMAAMQQAFELALFVSLGTGKSFFHSVSFRTLFNTTPIFAPRGGACKSFGRGSLVPVGCSFRRPVRSVIRSLARVVRSARINRFRA